MAVANLKLLERMDECYYQVYCVMKERRERERKKKVGERIVKLKKLKEVVYLP